MGLLKEKICRMNLILEYLFLFVVRVLLVEKCNFLIFNFFFRSRQIVSNIDIAPTIIDMAGIKKNTSMDGRSILQLIKIENGFINL